MSIAGVKANILADKEQDRKIELCLSSNNRSDFPD
jgi:hypothetical protein